MIYGLIGTCRLEDGFVGVRPEGMGIVYKVFVSNFTREAIQKENGKVNPLLIYHHQTESGDSLFGFSEDVEYDFFLRLLKCDGIGPKTAINILCLGSIANITQAIRLTNLKYLTGAHGVSKAKAEHIVLALQGKV